MEWNCHAVFTNYVIAFSNLSNACGGVDAAR
jgi:hypothetical protein